MPKHAYNDQEIPVKLKRIWFLSFHLPIPSLYNKEEDLIYPLDAFNWTATNFIMRLRKYFPKTKLLGVQTNQSSA